MTPETTAPEKITSTPAEVIALLVAGVEVTLYIDGKEYTLTAKQRISTECTHPAKNPPPPEIEDPINFMKKPC